LGCKGKFSALDTEYFARFMFDFFIKLITFRFIWGARLKFSELTGEYCKSLK
jgi:hypothetical protein